MRQYQQINNYYPLPGEKQLILSLSRVFNLGVVNPNSGGVFLRSLAKLAKLAKVFYQETLRNRGIQRFC